MFHTCHFLQPFPELLLSLVQFSGWSRKTGFSSDRSSRLGPISVSENVSRKAVSSSPFKNQTLFNLFHNIFYMICLIYHLKTAPLLDYDSQESEEGLFLIFIGFEIPVSDRNSCHCVMRPKFWPIPMPKLFRKMFWFLICFHFQLSSCCLCL